MKSKAVDRLTNRLLAVRELHPHAIALSSSTGQERLRWKDDPLTVFKEEMGELPKRPSPKSNWSSHLQEHDTDLRDVLMLFINDPSIIEQIDIPRDCATDLADIFQVLSQNDPFGTLVIFSMVPVPRQQAVDASDIFAALSQRFKEIAERQ